MKKLFRILCLLTVSFIALQFFFLAKVVLMNVIGLALSIVGTTWLARVHSFAPNLEPDGASVLGLNSCQFGKPVISVCKQCVSPENLT